MTRRTVIAIALGVSAIGAIGTLLAGSAEPVRTMHAYVGAFVFAMSVALGALVLLMIGHIASVRWFVAVRRLAEAAAGTIPILVVLAAPIVARADLVYPWARRDDVAHGAWMSPGVVLLRGAIYVVVWILFAELLRARSIAEDGDGVRFGGARQRVLSAAGLPLVGLTGSFATFDVLMSSVAGWSSNVLGLYVLTGGFAAAVGVVAIGLHLVRRARILPPEIGPAHAHAVGRLLLVGVCLWAYLAATSLIIVWSANLPREVAFYVVRGAGAWGAVSGVLAVGHFVFPFFALLPREAKRRTGYVAVLGGWLLLMHAIDALWLSVPASSPAPRALDLLPLLAVSGVLAAVGAVRFGRAEPIPRRDRDRERSLAYESP